MTKDVAPQPDLARCDSGLVLSGQPEPANCDRYIHLSFKNLCDHNRLNSGAPRSFIELGATPVDWHNRIDTRAHELYSVALDRAQQTLSRDFRVRTPRETELLVGKLCSLLAWRISRAESQLNALSGSNVALSSSMHVSLPSQPPKSSEEAMKVLASEEFGGFVESYLATKTLSAKAKVTLVATESFQREVVAERALLIDKAYGFVSRALRKFTRRSRVAVFSSYLGRFKEALLQLSLFQLPLLTESRPKFEHGHGCSSTRGLNNLQVSIASPEHAPLEIFIQACLDYLIPCSVAECFDGSRDQAVFLGWPVNPEVIFTSNNFDTDDVFKAYVVNHLARSKYVVGQHGGAYGTARMFLPCPELSTADLFLSWGWQGERVVPVGRIKPRVSVACGPYSGVVLVLRDKWQFFTATDPEYAMSIYLTSIERLVASLKQQGIEVAVRTHHVSCVQTEEFLSAISQLYSGVEVDRMTKPSKYWAKLNYGFVFCYDSTGMLEVGSSGGEFFAFLPEGSRGVLPKFEQNYRALQLSGLMSDDADVASSLIAKWSLAKDRTSYQSAIRAFLKGIVATDKGSFVSIRRVIATLLRKGLL